MAAKGIARAQRGLEVLLPPEELRATQRLDHDVELQGPVPCFGAREADAVHGDRVSDLGVDPALDDEAAAVEGRHPASLAHDAREHAVKATGQAVKRARLRARSERSCASCLGACAARPPRPVQAAAPPTPASLQLKPSPCVVWTPGLAFVTTPAAETVPGRFRYALAIA